MKMDAIYVSRRRKVAFIFIGIPALLVSYYVLNHIWWTNAHYCWGSAAKCVGL